MTNPLVAHAPATTGSAGAEAYDTVMSASEAIDRGDWAEGLLNAGAGGLDLLGVAADPLAGLAAAGVGWIIEHVLFLREPFDALLGNPAAIQAASQTWQNISAELGAVAGDYRSAVAGGTASWEGAAGDAYRAMAVVHATGIGAVGSAGQGMAAAVAGAGAVVGTVRGIVRDLIAWAIGDIVSALIKWGVAAMVTAGVALAPAIADAIRIAVKWAERITEWMAKLGAALKNLWGRLDELGSAGTTVREGIEGLVSRVGGANDAINDAGTLRLRTVDQPEVGLRSITDGTSPSMRPEFGTPDIRIGADGRAVYSPADHGGLGKLGLEGAKEAAKIDDRLDPLQPDDAESRR